MTGYCYENPFLEKLSKTFTFHLNLEWLFLILSSGCVTLTNPGMETSRNIAPALTHVSADIGGCVNIYSRNVCWSVCWFNWKLVLVRADELFDFGFYISSLSKLGMESIKFLL